MRRPPRGHQREDRGVLLRSMDTGESDLRLWILGETRGVFTAVAKGGRKSRRRFMGRLEPFTQGVFQTATYKGRDYLEAVDVRLRGDRIARDLGRYYLACYACEACLVFLERGHVAPGAYELLRDLLEDLETAAVFDDRVGRVAFEARFLDLQGLLPIPEDCSHCGAVLEGAGFQLDTIRGEWACALHAREGEPGVVDLDGASWALFEEIRERGFPLAPVDPERRASCLRAVNRLTALLFLHQLPGKLRSAALLNAHQGRELAAGESAS